MASYFTTLEEVWPPQQALQEFRYEHFGASSMIAPEEDASLWGLPLGRSDHRRKTISTCMMAQALSEPSVQYELPSHAMEAPPITVRPSARRRTWQNENTLAAYVQQPSPQQLQPMKVHLSTPEKDGGYLTTDPDKVSNSIAGQDDTASNPGIARSRSGSNLLAPPGLTPTGLPSHGSVLHGSDNCRPCAWFWKPGGCQNGKECGHCHLCPEGEIKNRKKGKLAVMRVGMSTPKSDMCNSFGLTASFGMADFGFPQQYQQEELYGKQVGFLLNEQASTTCSLSDDLSCASKSDLMTASPSTVRASPANTSTSGSDDEETRIPQGMPPGLTLQLGASQGSIDHDIGNCKPCAWFWKPSGCQNGNDCNYCHLCSKGELKARKKTKQSAMRSMTQGQVIW